MEKQKWILPYVNQYRRLFVLSLFLGALTILLGGALMFTSGYLISKSATRPESILMVYVPIVGVRAFGMGRAVFSYVERLSSHSLILRILSSMRVKLYNLVEPQVLSLHSAFRTGDVLGLLANDIEVLQNFYLRTLFPAIASLIIYTVIIISAGLFSIPFAILLAVFIGILLFVGPTVSLVYVKTNNESIKKGRNQLYQQFTDGIIGISDWIFSGNHSKFINNYIKKEEDLYLIESKKQNFVSWRDMINQLVVGTCVVASIAWAGGLSESGETSPVFIAAISLAMLSLLESFLPLSGEISEITTYQDALDRLEKIGKRPSNELNKMAAYPLPNTNNLLLELENLTFGYQQEKILLDGITATVKQGEKIALIGRSGSGKSTLLKLIQGHLQPTAGAVRLGGQNVVKNSLDMTKWMSVLNQKPYLFNTSLMNNIRLGNPEASDEEVYQVCKLVQLDDMINHLSNGYETNMQEAGQRFSGGEQQRIALARVLLQNTPIVLLDEPTVGLDPITEIKLLKTIFETLKDKTIIWVTHHLVGVEHLDRILLLDHGVFSLEGSHQSLMKLEEKYRRLYQLDHPF
ncbi:thiol reductant ABC exporter subunit CydC [Neobacillus dielmonensis]|uniref:thiol reductant ABC exporter subunit CydC n=1 Tax=Neobacillus dielmonensis TaxID=1347369 RepID=UPI0005AA51AA|nr:thiol reductant ABC exporter subunit CydC [Neobacillus dielmonensis]